MPTVFSQARLDQAIALLKRKGYTTQELADEMQVSYAYSAQLLKSLKNYKLIEPSDYAGRSIRWKATNELYTIPKINDNDYITMLQTWLKSDCNTHPRTNKMFNTHFMWSLLNIIACVRTYNRQQHESSRRQLLQYREQLVNMTTLIDSVLNNRVFWDKEQLALLINDPACPTTDEVNSWLAFAKTKLS